MNVADLTAAVRASWGPDTADLRGSTRFVWDEGNPSREQCGVTALVVRDQLGGELIIAPVGGTGTGWHYWNRLPSGDDLDLTREQFRPGEVVGEGRLVVPPDGFDGGPLAAQYALLAGRVAARLQLASEP